MILDTPIFNKSEYHFVRGTENPKIVYESNENMKSYTA